ncbi:MAG: HD domain-containing protein [Isosphaeraceae bacterium]
MSLSSALLTSAIEQALRLAAAGHAGQVRKGSGVSYVEHVVAVAWILDRAGFDEDVVIAGLLHDLVEDTSTSIDEIRARFGPFVAELVAHCSEVKNDEQGRKRPWIDRKRDHLAALANAPVEARAIVLADKLHNLVCIQLDLAEGRPIWTTFNADRDQVLWYYDASITCCGQGDPRLEKLAASCRERLAEVRQQG